MLNYNRPPPKGMGLRGVEEYLLDVDFLSFWDSVKIGKL